MSKKLLFGFLSIMCVLFVISCSGEASHEHTWKADSSTGTLVCSSCSATNTSAYCAVVDGEKVVTYDAKTAGADIEISDTEDKTYYVRMNGGSLTVNAPSSDIYFAGKASTSTLTAVEDIFVKGYIGSVTATSGHVIASDNSISAFIAAADTAELSVVSLGALDSIKIGSTSGQAVVSKTDENGTKELKADITAPTDDSTPYSGKTISVYDSEENITYTAVYDSSEALTASSGTAPTDDSLTSFNTFNTSTNTGYTYGDDNSEVLKELKKEVLTDVGTTASGAVTTLRDKVMDSDIDPYELLSEIKVSGEGDDLDPFKDISYNLSYTDSCLILTATFTYSGESAYDDDYSFITGSTTPYVLYIELIDNSEENATKDKTISGGDLTETKDYSSSAMDLLTDLLKCGFSLTISEISYEDTLTYEDGEESFDIPIIIELAETTIKAEHEDGNLTSDPVKLSLSVSIDGVVINLTTDIEFTIYSSGSKSYDLDIKSVILTIVSEEEDYGYLNESLKIYSEDGTYVPIIDLSNYESPLIIENTTIICGDTLYFYIPCSDEIFNDQSSFIEVLMNGLLASGSDLLDGVVCTMNGEDYSETVPEIVAELVDYFS